MPGPISNRTVTEVDSAPIDDQAHDQTVSAKGGEGGNQVEAFPDSDWYAAPSLSAPPDAEAAQSLQQLQAANARHKTDRGALRDGLKSGLTELARNVKDPGDFTQYKPGVGAFNEALDSDGVQQALAHLPRSEVKDLLMADVRKAWPRLPPDKVEEMTNKLLTHVGEHQTYQAARAIKDQAVAMMDQAAERFSTLSKDPARVSELAGSLGKLERGSGEDRALAANLRATMGLTGVDLNDHAAMSAAIGKQAASIARQSRELWGTEGSSLVFRTVKDMGLEAAVMKKAGIEPGSLSARALAQVKIEGDASQRTMDRLQTALNVELLLAMPVLGPGGAAAAVGDAILGGANNAKEYGELEERSASATALEAAGIGKAGSALAAQSEAKVGGVVLAAESVAAPLAGLKAEHAAHHLLHTELGARAGEVAGAMAAKGAAKLAEATAERLREGAD